MTAIAPGTLRHAVRAKFNDVAAAPAGRYRFRVGPALARDVGYPGPLLDALPASATESFTGLAFLHPRLGLEPGEAVLDLGCGAGLDAICAARAVAPGGRVLALDLADDMVAKARRNAEAAGVTNARFACAQAEDLPIRAGAVDAVLLNGILNLCPDKSAVVRELARVLRPAGRAIVAEITFSSAAPHAELRSADDWFR
jgi:arsenite methyltransferase